MQFILKRLLSDLFLAAAAVIMTAIYASSGGGFPLDDSWIHQTYGRNLAATGIWSFVPYVPSAASTSPLYTVVLAVGYRLGIPYFLWTHSLGAAALAGTAILGRRLALRASPPLAGIGLATGLALVFSWHLLWAAASGMETAIFGFMTMLLIWWAWRERDAHRSRSTLALFIRGGMFGIFSALTALTRPEGALLIMLIGGIMIIARPKMTWKGIFTWGAAAAALFSVVVSPYLAFNYQLTGGLLPNTAAAKQAFAAPIRALGFLFGVRLMTVPLLAGGQVLLIPGAVAYLITLYTKIRESRESVLLALLPLWGISLVALYAWWLPLNFQHGRYVIPALPALITCGMIGSAYLLVWSKRAFIPRVLVRAMLAACAVLFIVFAFGPGLAAYRLDVQVIEEEMVANARWIAENIPLEDTLALHDIGAVGYFAPRPIVDIAGLVSPEFIPLAGNPDGMWALLQANNARYLMAFPDQLPGDDPQDSRLCPFHESEGSATFQAGGEKMTIYALAWDGVCPS